jgi:hypothetical protein
MKPWDDPKTIDRFRRMRGAAKIRMAIEMAGAQLQLLRAGLCHQHPRMGQQRLEEEVASCLWPDATVRATRRSSQK